MAQHRVVQLEERQLHAFLRTPAEVGKALADGIARVGRLKLAEHFVGTAYYRRGHSGELCDMDAEAVLAAAFFELADEHHLAVDFLYGHIVVGNALECLGHLVELVVMGGKKGLGAETRILVNVFHYRPSNGNAVVGARAAPQLVEEHEAALAEVVEYRRRLVHLHHKRGFAERYVVGSPHTGENLVDYAYLGGIGRHEAADLRQQDD